MNKCQFKFTHDPALLDDVFLEEDDDIGEYWLEKKTRYIIPDDPENEIIVVYLDLTRDEWDELGIRDRLWGQSRVVNDKVVCYGSWHENSRYQRSDKFAPPARALSELALGVLHETLHGLYYLKGMEDLTHAHMYGYKKKIDDDSQDRYAVTPTPIKAYNQVLDKGEHITFFCIRTQETTDQFKKEIKSTKRIIHQPRIENEKKIEIEKRHLTPLDDYSWENNNPGSIVIHTLLGTIDGSYTWLKKKDLSYNYVIAEDGTIYEMIPPERSAWHAGVKNYKTLKAKKRYGKKNPNKHSVGIAFERNGEETLTVKQCESAVSLIDHLEKMFPIIYNKENIFSHYDINYWKPEESRKYRDQVLKTMADNQKPPEETLPDSLPSGVASEGYISDLLQRIKVKLKEMLAG